MKKSFKKLLLLGLTTLSAVTLVACGAQTEKAADKEKPQEKKNLVIGATSGPYADMVKKAIKPGLEKKGYTVEVKEFTDYVQPNNALAAGELDANLFQHIIYMKNFAQKNNLQLSDLIQVPTAPMGIYSSKYKSLSELPEKAELSLPGDATNAARAYNILSQQGLLKLNADVDVLKISQKDIAENPKNLVFNEIEAAGLPRAIESSDISAVPGNFALASGLDLTTALVLEKMDDNYRNRVVVNTKDKDAQFAKDIIDVVKSDDFNKVIDEQFKGFDKPSYK
ncbi:hypothetical protein GMA11_05210 [Granulicatella sp. zg-ZJ]|uniref:MetQ/NlpA family ABC transporter substrate-binding protein n=1 Tax=unclassified Granulicatella TaxID=2630493 RepID=UPI0013C094ED|nr:MULTISPECIES: MetQ/NlpA family ABC transporter substrate-binding protein [unclassified Granulicatella]MBS4750907.1 metal ABC transporter substrate-binding protein [Carnobacteriaceae bacterium zg-ZUI78]NEW62785.1 hypothetical protein [Granulicatella sp. zg-ZJ]NEW65409.1 hypothetical protein [Granulicatella sp. zg-84]QMI85208.1 hypothetical protein H1220_05630 [Carnobacteriaceae bacterium zg-84]